VGFGVWGGSISASPAPRAAAGLGGHREQEPPLRVADVEELAVLRRAARDEVVVLLAARGVGELLALLVDAAGGRRDVAQDALVRVAAAGHRQVGLPVVALARDARGLGRRRRTAARRREGRRVRGPAVATAAAALRSLLGLPLRCSSGEVLGGLLGVTLATGDTLLVRGLHRRRLARAVRLDGSTLRSGQRVEVEPLLDGDDVAPEEVLVARHRLCRRVDHQPGAVRAREDRLAALVVEGVGRVRAAAGPRLRVVPLLHRAGPQPEARAAHVARDREGLRRSHDMDTCKTRAGAGAAKHRLLLTLGVGIGQQGEPFDRNLGTCALDRCHRGC